MQFKIILTLSQKRLGSPPGEIQFSSKQIIDIETTCTGNLAMETGSSIKKTLKKLKMPFPFCPDRFSTFKGILV